MSENNELEFNLLMANGYGTIAKFVMKDRALSIEAKAIYAYLRSYSGAGNTAFPSRELMCHDLNISINRFNKYKNELLEHGYITVHRQRLENGFSKNIYTMPETVSIQNVDIGNVDIGNVDIGNVDIGNVDIGNEYTNKNNLNKNSINKNIDNKLSSLSSNNNIYSKGYSLEPIQNFYENNGFGTLSSKTIQDFNYWIDDFKNIGSDEENALELIIHAMKLAVDNNVRKYSYVNSILKNWEQKRLVTVEQIEAMEKEREQTKQQQPHRASNMPDYSTWVKTGDDF
ncbi:DnaD domain protein [Enterococcus italicus]|uniref:DnaD domain protein n=1 Tax=Enterococcus italicus TaxID=246144 RepID=UPI003FA316F8